MRPNITVGARLGLCCDYVAGCTGGASHMKMYQDIFCSNLNEQRPPLLPLNKYKTPHKQTVKETKMVVYFQISKLKISTEHTGLCLLALLKYPHSEECMFLEQWRFRRWHLPPLKKAFPAQMPPYLSAIKII